MWHEQKEALFFSHPMLRAVKEHCAVRYTGFFVLLASPCIGCHQRSKMVSNRPGKRMIEQ
jgi:hypothetical protein